MRIVQLLLGVVLAGGGGYLTWLNRALAPQLFPPDPHHEPWMLITGLVGILAGLVLLVGGLLPQPNRKAELAAAAERRQAAVAAADAYYAERARAADRDWRSGPLPPEPAAAPASSAAASPFGPSPFDPSPFDSAAMPPTAPPSTPPTAPSTVPSTAPPGVPPSASSIFPAASTLTPIPPSVDGPLPTPLPTPPAMSPAMSPPFTAPAPSPVPSPGPSLVFDAANLPATDPAAAPSSAPTAGPFAAIRAALAAGHLDDADRLLAAERTRLTTGNADTEIDLAELTGLAGDHAAASGRLGSAKWLWRLALQRFGAANAMASPAARAVSERLRLADQ